MRLILVCPSQSSHPLFEENWGTVRGNESELDAPETTSRSMYRITSVSKLFPVLEGIPLEQKGA